jgi:hypothetical protein
MVDHQKTLVFLQMATLHTRMDPYRVSRSRRREREGGQQRSLE